MSSVPDITGLLEAAESGDSDARNALVEVVYTDLRSLADRHLRVLPRGATLQPTALVNEAYLRLFEAEHIAWKGHRHFFYAAGRAMQHIVVEYIRRRMALKRGGGRGRVQLDSGMIPVDERGADVLDVSAALERLQQVHADAAEVVRLRYFAGLSHAQVAEALGLSVAKARREWDFAKAWLLSEISRTRGGDSCAHARADGG